MGHGSGLAESALRDPGSCWSQQSSCQEKCNSIELHRDELGKIYDSILIWSAVDKFCTRSVTSN